MAFGFFGVFSTGQWEVFKAFSNIQRKELVLRKAWLQKQLSMNGVFTTTYDGPKPVSFTCSAGSFGAKLLSAYRVLGGVPERDMLLRTRNMPVFKTKAQNITDVSPGQIEGGFSDVYSNGRRERGTQRFDRDLGLRVERLKGWQLEAIKAKRERLEFKIKRCLDYSDELQREEATVDALLDDQSRYSFDSQVVAVEVQMVTPNATNVVQNLDDVFGLAIGKPGDLSFADALQQGRENDERVPA